MEQAHCTQGVVKRYRDPHGLASGIIFYWHVPTIVNTMKTKSSLLTQPSAKLATVLTLEDITRAF